MTPTSRSKAKARNGAFGAGVAKGQTRIQLRVQRLMAPLVLRFGDGQDFDANDRGGGVRDQSDRPTVRADPYATALYRGIECAKIHRSGQAGAHGAMTAGRGFCLRRERGGLLVA